MGTRRASLVLGRTRGLVPHLADTAAWAVGLPAAVWTRYEWTMTTEQILATAVAVVLAVELHGLTVYARWLYRGRYAFGSFEDVRAVSLSAAATGSMLLVLDLWMPVRL